MAKKSLILFLVSFFSITSFGYSQRLTLNLGEVTLLKALKVLKKEAQVDFFYSDDELDVNRKVLVKFENTDLLQIVSTLVGEQYNVKINKDNIVLISPSQKLSSPKQDITLTGHIQDENGLPLPGASIIVKGSGKGTITDINGNFKLIVPKSASLIISFIGYKTQEVTVAGKTNLTIAMQADVSELEEVVITGVVERNKESFTGAVRTFSGTDLKQLGNQNVIQSLKSLDPSMAVLENTEFGSNPNVLPNIEVRGKTSVASASLRDEFGADPNQPLFILDGFETDLRTIVDLDMNRVASITILKDASSTALYGAKAANGVIVIETKRPEPGKMDINYTADFRVEAPDLSDYNLMNAAEKLEFERLSGKYTYYSIDPAYQLELDELYFSRLKLVREGVDTYWLHEPLQTGFTNGHSLYLNGGENAIQYGIGLNYRDVSGVMKGSGRETWGGNVDLIYRKNKVKFYNKLYVSGSDADESPYGSFADFARANPYFKKRNAEGGLDRYLEYANVSGAEHYYVPNPLYNASLKNKNNTQSFNVQNNLQAEWKPSNHIRVQGGLQLNKSVTTQETFSPPERTQYDDVDVLERGQYGNIRTEKFSYRANVTLSYARIFAEKHQFTANLRADIEENSNERLTVIAVGFPNGTNGNPAFAYNYQPNASPGTARSLYRRNNLLASVNYVYDQRFLFDATYRLDGSTAFGSNKKYFSFWAVGAGWNLHNEFELEGVDLLKLRANIGSTGNQNFGSVSSVSVYSYDQSSNIFGQGTYLSTLANPDLEWQNTVTTSIGADIAIFNRRVSATLNAYQKKTDPLVIVLDLPSSTGVSGYSTNAGFMDVKGVEAIIRVSPIYQLEKRIIWTLGLNASSIKSEYGGFNNKLEGLNKDQEISQSLLRFKDGYSPDDIWAVKSMGIDPGTGREVFLRADGQATFEYDPSDVTVVGNTRPEVEGVISSNLTYKSFTLGVNLRFRYGGDLFNQPLYNKVENISRENVALNQDRRALYDRWQNPGDIAQFKAISLTTETPISSRFVQKENTLIGESINIGYQLTNHGWVKRLGVKALRVNVYMNDIFHESSVIAERGISYPFSRAVSLSINATF
ncbi:SusC/RagA family TonB-linked outer membrane protein [Rapidithrix thailandica]|uniref:SusC/RagA family TonB-linked outer membrane protein n=1 Tax=Rapidithrix thailandica TaxID=413964 RepID=A0AAW9SCP2_9BACT